MSKRTDCKDEPYRSTKCSKTCTSNPCIAGPSSLTRRNLSSPPSCSSRTASPSLSFSAYSLISTAYSTPRKLQYAPDDYPRRSRSGRVDKGKKKASAEIERSVVDGMIGLDATVGVHLVGGRHMMNYTGPRKKWSHGMVAEMRNQAGQSNASLRSSSQSLCSTDLVVAQPCLRRVGPGSTPRRDSMEPEARHSTAQATLAARPTSVLGRKRTQDLKEGDKEQEMGSKKMWKFVKRAWTGFGRQ